MRRTDSWTAAPRRYAGLCKAGLSLSAAASALAAFLARSPRLTWEPALPWAGVFLLACGACALNQYQDRGLDAAMERTRDRPLPARLIPPASALWLSLVLLGAGFCLLAAGGRLVLLLAAAAVAWYNGVYAFLKRISPYAAIPGAVAGALPLAIGWVWAGGGPGQAGLWVLCGFFFIWQIPHFWLIVLEHGREFRRAGLPSLSDVFTDTQIRRLVSQWVLGTAAFSLLLSLGGLMRTPPARAALIAMSLWLGVTAVRFAAGKPRSGAVLFREMNVFMLAVVVLLCLDGAAAALLR
jgi:protoheme IX farnesyltransferase